MAVTVTLSAGVVFVTCSASGDTATPTNIISAGYGTLQGTSTIVTSNKIMLQLATGSVFDDSGWDWIINSGGSLRINETYGCGTWRKGWKLVGSTWVKINGGKINYVNFDGSNNAGGRTIGSGSTAPSGFPTTKPIIHWNDVTWAAKTGTSNGSASLKFNFASYGDTTAGTYCGFVFMDSLGDANGLGANAGFGGSFGRIEELTIAYANSGASTGSGDTTSIVQVDKLNYFGLYYGNNQVNTKFAIPNNLPFTGFAPVIISPTTNEYWGFFVSTGFNVYYDDPTFPTTYDYRSKHWVYQVLGTTNIRRKVSLSFKDSTGSALTGVTLRLVSSGDELVNAVQSGDYSAQTLVAQMLFTTTGANYRAPNTIKNYSVHSYKVRKYGYIEQSGSYNVEYAAYSSPFFMLPDSSLSGVSEATAAAITTAGINWSTKTITPTANLTYDQINARIAYELAQTANSAQADPRTIVGSNLTLASGWSLVVNSGITISAGTAITYLYVPTVTLNGTGQITAVYASTAGTSTVWQFQSVEVGTSLVVYDSSGVTKYFRQEVSTAGTYSMYIPPGTTGTYYYAVEKYGKKREEGNFPANSGGILFYVPDYQDDVGITQATKATVAAYTTLETSEKLYDYIAYFRLGEQGIKLGQIATRSGTAIDFGTYSGVVKATHTSVLSITGSTITFKANGLAGTTKYATIIATPPATWTANSTEVIDIDIEDGNGDSSITISASGISTFEIWKITDATNPDDYATGTLMATVGIGKWRFLHANGYKFVVRDTTTNFRVVVEAEKGVYEAALFFGAAVQLAQAAEVTEINNKVDIMQIDVDAIKGTGFTKDKHSLTNIKKKAALAAALSA